jgi:alanyl-tRNA synthetase
MKSGEVREKFIRFFEARGHRRLPSSSLIPRDDPTLMFTNAGMNQFKNIFLGLEKADTNRATTCQKCCRVTGKHNDFEMVGKTPRHHTFFEMLGNFSFGDYFKKEAIEFAYDLIVKEYGIPLDRLLFTVFRDDDAAYDLWHKHIGVSADRIYRFDEKENFWAMGETGPCGPCSEIHYDYGPEYSKGFPDADPSSGTNRFVELWNLVFMQYNKTEDGKMVPLAAPSVDTGAGLERITAVMQGKDNNYDTDLFLPLINNLADKCGVEYQSGGAEETALRVMADHTRAATFLIGDGLLPSNEGRGYVLRRIIRRGIRFAKKLEMKNPFLYEATGFVIGNMKDVYPELVQSRDFIARVMLAEEERFNSTISYGMNYFQEIASADSVRKSGVLPGGEIFKLYDTFGLPLDFTKDLAEEHNLKLDEGGFEVEMEKQRARARKAWKGSGGQKVDELYLKLGDKYKSEFRGYDEHITYGCEVLALIKNGKEVDFLAEGDEGEIILDKTPFYGESGGQVGDTGWLQSDSGAFSAEVSDTKKPMTSLTIHNIKILKGSIRVGERITARVNSIERNATMANHTATHLLQAALRNELGTHVKQAGSAVSPERLRFDFTHFSPISKRELQRVEEFVNRMIHYKLPVISETLSLDDAISKGAIALFDEKYGDTVRMITVQGKPPMTEGDIVSRELCGGTHAKNTSEIGKFVIISEGSVAAGIRRIEALTENKARELINRITAAFLELQKILHFSPQVEEEEQRQLLSECAELLRCSSEEVHEKTKALISEINNLEKAKRDISAELGVEYSETYNPEALLEEPDIPARIESLLNIRKRLEKDIKGLKLKKAEAAGSGDINDNIKKIEGVPVVIRRLDNLDAGGLRDFADRLKNRLKSCIIVLGAAQGDKALLLAGVTDDLVKKIDAVTLIRHISGAIGGGGGGRPDLAQAGGKKPENIEKALKDAEIFVEKILSGNV